ncbi:MAG: glycosyltransferase family 2 protein [Candidatus Levybacteria bacterium]|nr:glycosyltransferase family 2 protein [Candidatus Levybacteria bacterium]
MSISVIIPNYNGESLLKKNLPKVFEAVQLYSKESKEEADVIIVDDGSTDDSLDEVQSSYIKVQDGSLKLKIIRNEKNMGFSSTVNKGVREAEGEIVVLLNTDVSPEKDFLLPLIEHFKDEKVFAVGCLDKSIEGSKVVLRGRGIGSWKRGFLIHQRGDVNKNNTLWVSGGSGAFRKEIWEKLEGFNKIYNPFYWEDIDLSYRAQKSGYKILFEPKSIVVHEHEKGSIKSKYSTSKVKEIAYRNQFIFVWQNVTDPKIVLSHLIWLPYHSLKALINKDWAFFLGFFEALILLPKIIKSSFKVKKLFFKKDGEITASFS